MYAENFITILIALLGSGVIVAWFNRRKTSAETDKTIVEQAKTLVDELQEERNAGNLERQELRKERDDLRQQFREFQEATEQKIKQLETEMKVQELAIGNLTARAMKYQLALTITIRQLRLTGLEPMIEPGKIDAMKVEEMRIIAEGLSNVDRRRQNATDDG